ncbi:MAG: hypothetical protein HGA31_02215 [Candidatus Moranbacteria bacterium]|nr:hypothetical protein [Candidatus Moranbacteria bacterium]
MGKKKTKTILKNVAGAHVRVSVWMFVSYLALSVAYSPEFLMSDIRHKWSALADDTITITARVMGPPQKPTVTANTACVSGNLSVSIDWADDENSVSYDISRDGLPLVSGLTASDFSDSTVSVGTTYAYEVTANGPMGPGSAISDPISVATPSECVITFVPTLEIVSFDGKAVASYTGIPETESRKPVFSGTTNIPSAQMDFLVTGGSVSVSARVYANMNGYFSWKPPINLPYGTMTVFVTSTDPTDPTVTVSKSLLFKVSEKKEEKKVSESKPMTTVVPTSSTTNGPDSASCTIPLDFVLRSAVSETYQGRDLPFTVEIKSLDPAYEGTTAVATYAVVDQEGKAVLSLTENIILKRGNKTAGSITIPSYLREGRYRLRADLLFGNFDVSREVSFLLLPLPILNFGGGVQVTYPQLLSQLGTISLLLLLLLLLWASLFAEEYRMFMESARRITERNLIRAGFFGSGKGKGVSG